MKPNIRLATQEDLTTLLKFEQGLIQAERPMDVTIKSEKINYYDISEFIKNKDSDIFVVELDGNIVASGYARIKDDRHYLKHEKKGYLGFMFVPEEHRGKGLNKLIMKTLLKWCKIRGIFEIRLDVYQDNPSAIRAYEKVGFKKHMINMRMDITDLEV